MNQKERTVLQSGTSQLCYDWPSNTAPRLQWFVLLWVIFGSLFFFFRNLSFACPTYCIPQSELEAFFSLIQISLSLSAFSLAPFPRSFRLPSQPSVRARGISLSVFPPRHISLFSSRLSQHFIPAPYCVAFPLPPFPCLYRAINSLHGSFLTSIHGLSFTLSGRTRQPFLSTCTCNSISPCVSVVYLIVMVSFRCNEWMFLHWETSSFSN